MTARFHITLRSRIVRLFVCLVLLTHLGCTPKNPSATGPNVHLSSSQATVGAADESASQNAVEVDREADPQKAWTSLFDGQQLGHWRPSDFATQGEVTIEDHAIRIEGGDTCSGITWSKAEELPRCDYELQLQAKRIEGQDFFCALTFPVNDDSCSFIVGGWGGGLVGLSCLDGFDASENNTSSWQDFEQDRWYTIRIQVRADHLSGWIDDAQVVDENIAGREVSIRLEVDESRPLGIATWQTSAMIRQIQWRTLPPGDPPDASGDEIKPSE